VLHIVKNPEKRNLSGKREIILVSDERIAKLYTRVNIGKDKGEWLTLVSVTRRSERS
jgi:hypothetical protein